jgi:hypothetical protein
MKEEKRSHQATINHNNNNNDDDDDDIRNKLTQDAKYPAPWSSVRRPFWA